MSDAWFTYAHAAFWAVAMAAYGARVAAHGVFRSERVAKIGGTALVGRGVMDATYWVIDPAVRGLARAGVTPDQLTWSSLVLAGGAAAAVAYGWFGLACLLLTASMLCDVLDGQVARATGVGSMRGEILDSAIDRYCEMLYLGGLALWCDERWQLAIVVGAIVASFMVSYAGVLADAAGAKVPRGLMRRHERGVYLLVGAGLAPLLGPASALASCAVVAVLGNVAAIVKFTRIARAV